MTENSIEKTKKRPWQPSIRNKNRVIKESFEEQNISIQSIEEWNREQENLNNWTIKFHKPIPTQLKDDNIKYWLRFNRTEIAEDDEIS